MIDLKDLDHLITNLEKMGANVAEIADKALTEAAEPSRAAFASKVPRSKRNKIHAQDHVTSSKTKVGKSMTYKIIGPDGQDFKYLYMVDAGTSKMPAYPWRRKALNAAKKTALPIMRRVLEQEIKKRLEV